MEQTSELAFVIRSYRPSDREACRRLYLDGLIGGKIAAGDTGSDIDCIDTAYLQREGNHFWVAELTNPEHRGEVIGMVGVRQHEGTTTEIRRLRVDAAYRRRGVGSGLMESALRFCEEHQCLRIILDTFMERGPAIHLFEKFRFRHGRTRRVGEKDLLYFYRDLYGSNAH